MNKEEIHKIETELGISLPIHYTNYLTNFPTELLELKDQLGELTFIFDSSEQIIMTNQALGFHKSDKSVKYKLCIGTNGGGDFYLIDLVDLTNERVYYYDHEESVERYYDKNLDSWDWDKLDSYANIQELANETLELFGLS